MCLISVVEDIVDSWDVQVLLPCLSYSEFILHDHKHILSHIFFLYTFPKVSNVQYYRVASFELAARRRM